MKINKAPEIGMKINKSPEIGTPPIAGRSLTKAIVAGAGGAFLGGCVCALLFQNEFLGVFIGALVFGMTSLILSRKDNGRPN